MTETRIIASATPSRIPDCPAGEARFIHTYMDDANPLPSFEGEPETDHDPQVICDTFTDTVWESLNEDNKVSLFVRYIDIATGTYETQYRQQE